MKHEAPWVVTEGEFRALTRLEALSLEQASEFPEGLIRMQTAGCGVVPRSCSSQFPRDAAWSRYHFLSGEELDLAFICRCVFQISQEKLQGVSFPAEAPCAVPVICPIHQKDALNPPTLLHRG